MSQSCTIEALMKMLNTLKWNLRIMFLHPPIERIIQKEICKQRTNYPSLRCPFIPMNQAAIFQLRQGLQPSFDV